MNPRQGNPFKRLARLALAAYAVFQLTLLVSGILLFPGYAARRVAEFTPNAFWNAAQTQAAVAELDWPIMSVPWIMTGARLVVALVGMIFGLFLLWRKSDDWFGMFLAAVFLTLGGGTLIAPVVERIPALAGLAAFQSDGGWQILFIVFYLFPDGRFVPRWTRWMPFAWLSVNLVQWLSSYSLFSAPGAGLWVGVGLVSTAVGSQVYRYFRRSTAVGRQQTKWVVAALASLFALVMVAGPLTFRPPPADRLAEALPWAMALSVLFSVSFLVVPAALLIAIARYRLWDIDVLIRRTLIYSVLSAVLGLTYFGSILVLENLFRALTGQGQNALVTVVSTLGIAALFGPLRARVQRGIDQRFYRKKYDAARTLAQFSAAARDQVDLDALKAQLLDVTQATLQPARVSLWLRPTLRAARPAAFGSERHERA